MLCFARLIAVLALLPLLVFAAGAEPTDAQKADIKAQLFERLASATTEQEGRAAEDAIWQLWVDHPDPETRDAIARGMRQRDSYDWDTALESFTGVIAKQPDYAEGWNQRAFIHFLKEDFEASYADLENALALEPLHFGALSGQALILMRTGQFEAGQMTLKKAVALHPFLKERGMLVPE
jgi:tetratricopeptide (TPR) repeat protein